MSIDYHKIRLSDHFYLSEFLNLQKYPDNVPSIQTVGNLAYGCATILEPARMVVGEPLIVTSGYRNERVNRLVGGVANSQHLVGEAADITVRDPEKFRCLVDFLSHYKYVDQLLTAKSGWLHVSWSPSRQPRNMVRIGYYR